MTATLSRAVRAALAIVLLAPPPGTRAAGPGAAAAPNPLVAPARAVSDYLEAVAAAAPPRPRGARSPPAPTGDEPRWARVRGLLAPRPAPAAPGDPGAGTPLAPWAELGRDGAFLGYELTAVRRAARGTAVVTARERTTPSPDAQVVTTTCAYLVVPVGGRWLIADRRCAGDFSDADVRSRESAAWHPPPAPAAGAAPRDAESLPDDPE